MKVDIQNGILKFVKFEKNDTPAAFVIPDSVTQIGCEAFKDCGKLTGVTIPKSVIDIGHDAFSGCNGLTSVIIPDSVTSISDGAFENCTGLKSIAIPNSVTSLDDSLFSGCSGLTSVKIPKSVIDIGPCAFRRCTGLKSITIPESVTCIENDIFSGTGEDLQVCFEMGTKEKHVSERIFENSNVKFIYLSKDGKKMVFSCYEDKNLKNGSHEFNFGKDFSKLFDKHFRENYAQLKN